MTDDAKGKATKTTPEADGGGVRTGEERPRRKRRDKGAEAAASAPSANASASVNASGDGAGAGAGADRTGEAPGAGGRPAGRGRGRSRRRKSADGRAPDTEKPESGTTSAAPGAGREGGDGAAPERLEAGGQPRADGEAGGGGRSRRGRGRSGKGRRGRGPKDGSVESPAGAGAQSDAAQDDASRDRAAQGRGAQGKGAPNRDVRNEADASDAASPERRPAKEGKPAGSRRRNAKGGPKEGAAAEARGAKPGKPLAGAKRSKRGAKRRGGDDEGPQPGNRLPKSMIPKNLPDDIGNRAPREPKRPAHLDDEAYDNIGNRAVTIEEAPIVDENFGNRDNLNYTNPFPSDSNLLGAAELYAVGGGRGRNARGRPNARALHNRGQGNVGVWIGGTLEPGLMKPRGGKEANGNVALHEPEVEEVEVDGNRFGYIPGNGLGGGRKAGANGSAGGRGKGGRAQGARGQGGGRGQGGRSQGGRAQGERGAQGQGGGDGARQGAGANRGRGKGRARQSKGANGGRAVDAG